MNIAIHKITFLPIYDEHNDPTYYVIEKLYDTNLPNYLAEIRDIETDIVYEVRLKSTWFFPYSGEMGAGIRLTDDIIKMIDINFFERF